MSHVLRHHGNNSLTYTFTRTGAGDYLAKADWLALPSSRIKDVLLRAYEGASAPALIASGMVGHAEEGFAATVLTGDVVGTPSLSFDTSGGSGRGTTIIGYEIDVPNGTVGILRISLAYSASE